MGKDILYPLRRLHGWLHDYKEYNEERQELKRSVLRTVKEFKKRKKLFVFLVLTPEHGNLGDHAIAYAETVLLKKMNIGYIEITGMQLGQLNALNIVDVMNGVPILINGGGNLGTLWIGVEHIQRIIFQSNNRSLIMVLPNTIFYEDTDWGKDEFEKSKSIYKAHKNLYLYAREKNSFDIMREAYRNVKLVPDMVLSLPMQGEKKERKGCLLCLRSDHERTRTIEQEKVIRQQAESMFGDCVIDTDMVVKGNVPVEQREKALQDKFNEFSGAELVITDRLHGMIFCAVTGTPCIVIDSRSPKVRGCYEWIQHLDYIRFADDVSQIAEEYERIPKKEHVFDNSHLMPYFDELARDIKDKL